MEDFLFQVKSFLPEVHFYIMWFSLLCAFSCLIKDSTSFIFRPNAVKIAVFVLLLFAGFTWAHDVSALKNTEDFSMTADPVELLQKKYDYSKLQRDVYLEGLEIFCLVILLVLPRYHDYYNQTIKAFKRQLEQSTKKNIN